MYIDNTGLVNQAQLYAEFNKFADLFNENKIHTLVPILPLLLKLEGQPYHLKDHFAFEPLFNTNLPTSLVLRTGRQTSKTTSMAARALVMCMAIPYFKILFVTPLYEQIRRFSNNRMRPFIETSPIRSLILGNKTENSVLQRSFKNLSAMFFSYAFLDADRVRGISSDCIVIDETQDLDPAHLPVIKETMSHSNYGLIQYAGTPKTRDNTLEGLWSKGSMAEWCVPCSNCKHLNIPAMGIDLERMIGPMRDDICEQNPAVICSKCRKPVNPRNGRWIHKYPAKRFDHASYHIPQIIMPIHYSRPEKWAILLGKQHGSGNTTTAMFYNEVLGEGYDESVKLISMTELEKAGCMHQNHEDTAVKLINNYTMRVLGIDHGGGGEEGVSFTTLAVLGLNPSGRIDVIFGKRLLTPHDHLGEAKECLRIFNQFQCNLLAHDYTGAGSLRETFLIHAGLPSDRSMPIQYVRAASSNILNFIPATIQHPKNHWRVDKARSLQLTCYAIKLGRIFFFKYDYIDADNPGLLHDFLALIENKVPTGHGGDIYTIQKMDSFTDDFAHAVNMGALAIWHANGNWPRFGEAAIPPLTPDQERDLNGWDIKPWER